MTKEEAIALHDSKFWEAMSYRDRAMFQLFERKLCKPFSVFHEAVEKTLGRPVFTHEFGLDLEGLRKEVLGERPAPTLEEVMNLIPADKRVVLVTPNGGGKRTAARGAAEKPRWVFGRSA